MDKKDIISRVKVLAGMNRDEDEQKELEGLNAQLATIKANEEAAKLLAQAEADAKKDLEADTEKKIGEAIKAERAKWEAKERRLDYSEGATPHQTRYHDMRKYENLDAADLSVAFEVGKSLGVNFDPNAIKAMSLRIAELKDNNTSESRKGVEYVQNAF